MSIFDALTGAAGHQAASDQRNVLSALVPQMANTGQAAFGQAGDALRAGFGGARDDLSTGYGAATNAINTGAGGALGYLQAGQGGALGQLDRARGDLGTAAGAYDPLTALAGNYGRGAGLYSDSLGINGAEGNARAGAAFQPSQAYNFNLDQGLEAINRRRNMGGMLNSGNADRDAQVFGAGLASNEMKGWQDRLAGFNPLQLAATQGAATGRAGLGRDTANVDIAGAGLMNTGGRDQAGVASQHGNSLADLARSVYGAQAGVDTAEGGALAGNAIGGAQNWQNIFGKGMDQWNNTIQQDAATSNAASANSLKLGTDLFKTAVGAFAGMPVGSFGGPSGGSDYAGLGGWK